jgi:hypothetical protein
VLENVRAVDGLCGARRDGETFDHVAVVDVFGIERKTVFHQ